MEVGVSGWEGGSVVNGFGFGLCMGGFGGAFLPLPSSSSV